MSRFDLQPFLSCGVADFEVLGLERCLRPGKTIVQSPLALPSLLGSSATLEGLGLAWGQLQDKLVGFSSLLVFLMFNVHCCTLQPFANLPSMLKLAFRFNRQFLKESVARVYGKSLARRLQTLFELSCLKLALCVA